MTDYIPSTDEVRTEYMRTHLDNDETALGAEFDRWFLQEIEKAEYSGYLRAVRELTDDTEDAEVEESGSIAPENPVKGVPEFERILRGKLSETYPKFESVGFDGSLYWKSLEEHAEGDIIEYKGKEYRVRYGWQWTSYGPIPIYMAELDPAGFDRATHVPGS